MIVKLIGPGGSGKTTTGKLLSSKLGIDFVDVDEYFLSKTYDINYFINRYGYFEYAKKNIENYIQITKIIESDCVIALSSGFMIYPDTIHPEYVKIKKAILLSKSTFLLLASFNEEECVEITVNRQLNRNIPCGTRESETKKIQDRFTKYNSLNCHKISTEVTPQDVVKEIIEKC